MISIIALILIVIFAIRQLWIPLGVTIGVWLIISSVFYHHYYVWYPSYHYGYTIIHHY